MIDSNTLDKVSVLLQQCESRGAQVFLGTDGLAKLGNPSLLSKELLQSLRDAKTEIAEYLSVWRVESPTDIPFVARNLDVVTWPVAWVGDSEFIFVGERPHYRLTPDVYVWFVASLEGLQNGPNAASVVAALPVLDSLGQWISRHYRPHEIAGAYARRIGLPKVEYVDRSIPDRPGATLDEWLESWQMKWTKGKGYSRA